MIENDSWIKLVEFDEERLNKPGGQTKTINGRERHLQPGSTGPEAKRLCPSDRALSLGRTDNIDNWHDRNARMFRQMHSCRSQTQ